MKKKLEPIPVHHSVKTEDEFIELNSKLFIEPVSQMIKQTKMADVLHVHPPTDEVEALPQAITAPPLVHVLDVISDQDQFDTEALRDEYEYVVFESQPIILDKQIEKSVLNMELPVDGTPILESFLSVLQAHELSTGDEFTQKITEYTEGCSFEAAREVEITLLAIAAYTELVTDNKFNDDINKNEILETIETLYTHLAMQLGIDLAADPEKATQFRALIEELLPEIMANVLTLQTHEPGTHEVIEESVLSSVYASMLSNTIEPSLNWLGRYTLLLAGTVKI